MRRLVVLFCLFLLCIQEIYAQQQVSDEKNILPYPAYPADEK